MKEIKIRVTFTEEVLGSLPSDEEIYRNYIASKAPDAATIEQEVEAVGVDEVAEKQMTVFAKTADGKPFVYDYQWRGFFKEMCGILKKIPGTESSLVTQNKKLIDDYVFIKERMIPINTNGLKMGVCQRPLRAETALGPRTALAISESVPEGSTVEFTVTLVLEKGKAKKGSDKAPDYEKALYEWLDYGKLKGFGQWRNSGKGRFDYEIIG